MAKTQSIPERILGVPAALESQFDDAVAKIDISCRMSFKSRLFRRDEKSPQEIQREMDIRAAKIERGARESDLDEVEAIVLSDIEPEDCGACRTEAGMERYGHRVLVRIWPDGNFFGIRIAGIVGWENVGGQAMERAEWTVHGHGAPSKHADLWEVFDRLESEMKGVDLDQDIKAPPPNLSAAAAAKDDGPIDARKALKLAVSEISKPPTVDWRLIPRGIGVVCLGAMPFVLIGSAIWALKLLH